MSTVKFKVGDKVQRTYDDHNGMVPGDIGTIVRIDRHGDIALEEFGGEDIIHSGWKFKLVEPVNNSYPIC